MNAVLLEVRYALEVVGYDGQAVARRHEKCLLPDDHVSVLPNNQSHFKSSSTRSRKPYPVSVEGRAQVECRVVSDLVDELLGIGQVRIGVDLAEVVQRDYADGAFGAGVQFFEEDAFDVDAGNCKSGRQGPF